MQIRLRQYSFTISEPFQPGHRLEAEEAEMLNRLRAEQIKSNMRRAIDRACQSLADGELLSQEDWSKLQARIDFLDWNFKFKPSGEISAQARSGILEVEAMRVAEEQIEIDSRKSGLKPPTGEALEELVFERSRRPEVIEEARMRVAERQRAAARVLEELL